MAGNQLSAGGLKFMNKSCVVIVCNYSFMDYAAFLVRQIKRYNICQFDIVVASDVALTEELMSLDVLPLKIEATDFTQNLPKNDRLQHFAYWRLVAIEKLAREYDRILYLDTDIFCAAPGIDDLFEIPMKGKALAAVLDVHQHYRPSRKVPEFEGAALPHARYFNSGVLLVDGKLWQSKDVFEKVRDIGKSSSHLLSRHDQSLLNLVFHNDWLELSPVWNWQKNKKNLYISIHVGPRLIHYAGASKLWTNDPVGKNRSHWLMFDHATFRLNEERKTDLARLHWRLLATALWYRSANLRYLQRFEHDFHTISQDN